jgi:phosphatidylglycerol---prolipoprotein diacylglyceryl transferase
MPMFPVHIGLDPIITYIGPVALRWYGLMIGIGIAVGLMVDAREADRTGFGRDTVYSLATWLIIFGIIGGRLYYVVQNDFGYFLTHPQDILATWQGGMAFFGTIFACFIVILIFAYRRQLSFWRLLDTLVLGLPLGQVFGRIGNMVNGDIVGYRTNSAFAFIYTNPHSFIDPVDLNHPVFPAALVELLMSLAIFGILWYLRTRLRTPGMLSVAYLIAYSISQFAVFFWRANSVTLFGLKQAQLTSIALFIVCIPLGLYLWQHYKGRPDAMRVSTATEPVEVKPTEQAAIPEEASRVGQ